MEGKSLKDPDISKDKLCGILEKIQACGMQCDQPVSCVERRDGGYGIRAPPSGTAMAMFSTQHISKDTHLILR